MTEIPEHLLKRSRERRQALGTAADVHPEDGSQPAPKMGEPERPTTDAVATPGGRAAVAVPTAPAPPEPDTAAVAAAKRRQRIPFWAMAALSLMPIWALMYARAVTAQPEQAAGPLGVGAEVYASAGCAGCHGPTGNGTTAGYAFSGGAVLDTFPRIEDQIRWVYFGTSAYNLANVDVAGNPQRPGGPHIVGALGPMPGFGADVDGALADHEILAVVCHERYGLGGADPSGDFADEYQTWCAEDSELFTALEEGTALSTIHTAFDNVIPIGDTPAPGSPG